MSAPHVFSYASCSTPDQAMGDSEKRQLEAAEAWAKRKGFTLEPLGFDKLSSFRGSHRKKGVLGAFRKLVKGRVTRPGSILVVEKITRLSREGAIKALKEIVFELLDTGITLQVLAPERAFTAEALEQGMLHALIALLDTAPPESKDKSDYAKRQWSRRRLKAREGQFVSQRPPAWLRITGRRHTRRFRSIPGSMRSACSATSRSLPRCAR